MSAMSALRRAMRVGRLLMVRRVCGFAVAVACLLLRPWVTMVLQVVRSSDVLGDRMVLGELDDRACLSEGKG